MENVILHPFLFLYQVWQFFIDIFLSPKPPTDKDHLTRPKIAIIGAGLTGVSAASHCIGHGYDVHIFEAGPREELGGIWSVSTSLAAFESTIPDIYPNSVSTILLASRSILLCTASIRR